MAIAWGSAAQNSPWWVAAYFGCLRMGAILVPLDLRSGARLCRTRHRADGTQAGHPVATDQPPLVYPAQPWLLEDLEQLPPARDCPQLPAVTSAMSPEVIFTSGTTGDPKGVILTHGNITANAASALQVVPSHPDQRLLSVLPLSHMFEQTVGLLLPLSCGASIYYPVSRQPTMLFRDLQTQGITSILAVPQLFALLMVAIEREVAKAGKQAGWQRLSQLAGLLPMAARRVLFRGVHRRLGRPAAIPGIRRSAARAGVGAQMGDARHTNYPRASRTSAAPIISGTTLRDPAPGTVGRAVPGVEIASRKTARCWCADHHARLLEQPACYCGSVHGRRPVQNRRPRPD